MKVSDIKKRNAVARIIAGKSSAEVEAQSLGVSARQIRRWVASVEAVTPKATEERPTEGPSENVNPPGTDAPEKPNDALNAALDAAGEESEAGKKDAPGPMDISQATAEMESFVVETYSGFRAAVGSTMVTFAYAPPLDPTSPEVMKVLRAGPAAVLALKANAPRLYPILVKWASGWAPLVFALGTDTLGMFLGLSALAKSKGWTPPAKDETPRRPSVSKAFDFAQARQRQQEIDDRQKSAGTMQPPSDGKESRGMNAPTA